MPTLNLFGYRLGINITFTPQDLFIEKGDYLYFYVAYDEHALDDWYIGTILLEKYITVFDNYEKKFSILKKNEKNNPPKGDSTFTVKIIWIIVLVVILTGIAFGIIGVIFGKNYYQKRKKKANELNDEYEYPTHSEETKDKNLLIN